MAEPRHAAPAPPRPQVWECSPDESNRRVHDFFRSRHFAQGVEVIPGAADALGRLRGGGQCELVVVTSRQHVIQGPTLAWLDRHFAGLFEDVYFGNHWALEGVSRAKSEICRCALGRAPGRWERGGCPACGPVVAAGLKQG